MNLLAMTLDILKDLKKTLTLDVLYAIKILNIFKIVKTGWLLTILCSFTTAAIFIFAGELVASLFIDIPELITLAASLLFVSGIFQIVDGMQVASTGLLRGLHDTKIPAKMAILSYWAIGIPAGYCLAHFGGLQAKGMWWGLALGLGIASILLSTRLWRKIR